MGSLRTWGQRVKPEVGPPQTQDGRGPGLSWDMGDRLLTAWEKETGGN